MPEKRVLVAIENRFAANYVLKALLNRQWAASTEFRILHVIESPAPFDVPPSYWDQRTRLRHGVELLLNDLVLQIEQSVSASVVTMEIREGDAREQILYVARKWKSDLIVMGTHGHRGLNRFLIGSVAHPVSAHAPCSVMVVKQNGLHDQTSADSRWLRALSIPD